MFRCFHNCRSWVCCFLVFLKDLLFLSLIEYVTQVNGNKRYFVPNLYLKSECFNCYHKMNLFESPLSRDLLLVSSFSVAQKLFLAAKCLTWLCLRSHPQQVILPPTQLCWYCHLLSFLINLIRELVQVIFLSTLFLISNSFGVACCSAWSHLNSFFAEAIEGKRLISACLPCLL